MKPQKLESQTKDQLQEQVESTAQQERRAAAREFATAEELLRYDAAQTPVPPEVAQRLAQSLAAEPPKRPWWKIWSQG